MGPDTQGVYLLRRSVRSCTCHLFFLNRDQLGLLLSVLILCVLGSVSDEYVLQEAFRFSADQLIPSFRWIECSKLLQFACLVLQLSI